MTDDPDRQWTTTRVFDAPARLLFAAYSQPEHLMRWFGPVGWPLTLCEVDFRVGGRFRFAMTGPSGEQNTPFGGEYLRIEPDRRIVYDNGFETPGSPRMVHDVSFDEVGGRTTLTMVTTFETVTMKDEYLGVGMAEGTDSGFDQLADVVADLAERRT